MKNEHVILKSASSRVTLSVAKGLAFLFALMLPLTACSDYEADYEDMYGYMERSSSSKIESGVLTDSRDGKTYKTVTIGSQTWMAENLNYDPGNVSNMGSYAWSGCYGNESSNCTKYGRLYTWEVAMDDASCAYGKACNASLNPSTPVRGVCPSGWHLPSHREFEKLINFIDPSFGYNHTGDDNSSTAGKYLKSKSGWNSNGNGTDAFGFSALPGGYRSYRGSFDYAGFYAYFWSSGEDDSNLAFHLALNYGGEDAGLYYSLKNDAGSVRCLKDSSPTSGEATSSSSQAQPTSSSSSVIPDSDRGSSSSVASSSSLKAAWAYLNPSVSYGEIVDSRDNQTYKTVTIGTQTWMAENLNYSTSNSYCYDDNSSNCDKYGRLYTWSAAMNACPSGWHLPSDTEWNTLWTAVGGIDTAGTKLKSTSGWSGGGNGTDSFGFAVLPAGCRGNLGDFDSEGYYANFWSSTESNSYDAYNWYFYYYRGYVGKVSSDKDNGFSVRCLWD